MGKTLFGSIENQGNVDLLKPDQQNFLSQLLGGGNAGAAGQAFGQLLQPFDPEQFEGMFQKSFVDPAQQTLQRQIIPGIKEQFLGLDESGSSALNQALSQSATDLSTALGSQYMNQYNQGQNNLLQALGLGSNVASQRTFEPLIRQQQGILGPLLGGAGQGLAGGIMGLLGGF